MKINQLDSQVYLPFNYNNNNEVISRQIKENRGRINNINNEIIQMQLKESPIKKINFFKELVVTNEDFQKAKEISEELLNSFNNNLFLDILTVDKLISIQKHLMEIFNYLIYGDQNFEWNNFRRKIEYNELISRMKYINYDILSPKQFNFYINRLIPNMELPKFIPISTGMDHLYKWVKCQITIYIFLVNSKKLNISKISKINSNIITNVSDKNKSTINNNSSYFIEHNYLISNNSNENNKKSEIIGTNSNINSIMITNLPIKSSSKYKKNFVKSNDQIKPSKIIAKNLISFLNYNALREKIIREQKVMKHLPLLNNRTFGQMRQYYHIRGDSNDRYYQKKHLEDIEKISIGGIKNNNKIVSMISNNKLGLIGDTLSQEKLDEILE
jgi:hypothetical protein